MITRFIFAVAGLWGATVLGGTNDRARSDFSGSVRARQFPARMTLEKYNES